MVQHSAICIKCQKLFEGARYGEVEVNLKNHYQFTHKMFNIEITVFAKGKDLNSNRKKTIKQIDNGNTFNNNILANAMFST